MKTTLLDFYKMYPYKKQNKDCLTCPPYIKDEEHTQHPDSLTYKEWKAIIKCFLKYLTIYLARGYTYRFRSLIGEFEIVRYKPKKKKIDFNKTLKYYMNEFDCSRDKAIEKIRELDDPIIFKHYQKDFDGWTFILAWFRSQYPFKFGKHWKVSMSKRGAWRSIFNYLKEQPTRINKLTVSKFNELTYVKKKKAYR